jgi:hypothetical protein
MKGKQQLAAVMLDFVILTVTVGILPRRGR